jgi:predicted metal-dependent enzyme (double-stranded beta helix superfamily)
MLEHKANRPVTHRLTQEQALAVQALLADTANKHELAKLAQLPAELALREVAPLLAAFAKERKLVGSWNRPCSLHGNSNGPYAAHQYSGQNEAYFLGIFIWPAGSSTQIHDHSCWGAFCCVAGVLLEERYVRLDDGSRPNRAHVRKAWQRIWNRANGCSSLLPYEGGIHRVFNPNNKPVISIHLYGPPDAVDGRDYDPAHDYVCDRLTRD